MLEDTVWLAALTPVAEYALTPAAEVWLPSSEMAAPGLRKAALLTSTREPRTSPGGGGGAGGATVMVCDESAPKLCVLPSSQDVEAIWKFSGYVPGVKGAVKGTVKVEVPPGATCDTGRSSDVKPHEENGDSREYDSAGKNRGEFQLCVPLFCMETVAVNCWPGSTVAGAFRPNSEAEFDPSSGGAGCKNTAADDVCAGSTLLAAPI